MTVRQRLAYWSRPAFFLGAVAATCVMAALLPLESSGEDLATARKLLELNRRWPGGWQVGASYGCVQDGRTHQLRVTYCF